MAPERLQNGQKVLSTKYEQTGNAIVCIDMNSALFQNHRVYINRTTKRLNSLDNITLEITWIHAPSKGKQVRCFASLTKQLVRL